MAAHPTLPRKPQWLKVRPPSGERYVATKERVRRLGLATVCEEARCPNVGECWSAGTATLMLMGDVCTRGCRFCAVKTARKPPPIDPDEAENAAQAVAEMGLDYVVLTSVDRDDLPDGGAAHFSATISAIHRRTPEVLVEALVPDFQGSQEAIAEILSAGPSVYAHNVEVVRRLTSSIRDPRAGYDLSLDTLRVAKTLAPDILTKSSIMVGLGETEAEIIETLEDLIQAGVSLVTLGQYLRPSARHAPVFEFVSPAQFDGYAKIARELGFLHVASGPLVRSSYRAGELFVRGRLRATSLR